MNSASVPVDDIHIKETMSTTKIELVSKHCLITIHLFEVVYRHSTARRANGTVITYSVQAVVWVVLVLPHSLCTTCRNHVQDEGPQFYPTKDHNFKILSFCTNKNTSV